MPAGPIAASPARACPLSLFSRTRLSNSVT